MSEAIASWIFSIGATVILQKFMQNNQKSIKSSLAQERLLVATRIHGKNATTLPSIEAVHSFISMASEYADVVLICLECSDISNDYEEAIRKNSSSKAQVVQIRPWGYFISALNYSVQVAQDYNCSLVAFQSLECLITKEKANQLKVLMYEDTLVAGLRLEGHAFALGCQELTGRTTPWNTMAIWNVDHLGKTGFPLIGDGYSGNRAIGGVEEVTAISLLQYIDPILKAYLVDIQSDNDSSGTNKKEWDTVFEDLQRKAYHEQKMRSKESRPREQMQKMNISPGKVEHIIINL